MGVERMREECKNDTAVDDGGDLNLSGKSQGKEDALTWAQKLRSGNANTLKKKKKRGVEKEKGETLNGRGDDSQDYTGDHIKDQNLIVTHSQSEFETGKHTILTLTDKSILDENNNVSDNCNEKEGNENELENINMTEASAVKDNLKRKRMIEMGSGRSGGYSGFDDDEFEELGGSQLVQGHFGSIRRENGTLKGNGQTKNKGFKIGDESLKSNDNTQDKNHNLLASKSGQSISLVSGEYHATNYKFYTDFMTTEEQNELDGSSARQQEKEEKRRKKKERKMFRKIKKQEKSNKKWKSLQQDIDDNGDNDVDNSKDISNNKMHQILSNDLNDHENKEETLPEKKNNTNSPAKDNSEDNVDRRLQKKRAKYDSIVDKGNKRTQAAFSSVDIQKVSSNGIKTLETDSSIMETDENDEENDDAFLNVALAKARRLRRLREMSESTKSSKVSAKGSDAVVDAIHKLQKNQNASILASKKGSQNRDNAPAGGISFELDPTREFTSALRARSIQTKRNSNPSTGGIHISSLSSTKMNKNIPLKAGNKDDLEEKNNKIETAHDEDDIQHIESLAEQIKEHEDDATTIIGGFGSTGTKPIGRGLAGVVSMLKHTGEITGKNAGKEEMRGRAKDERTYEDYQSLDLKKVVKMDITGLGGNDPSDKDVEFSNREIKLEYRDEHGRLLTRKEAYRNLCYQFHGHGSSKKNEERKLRQIERELAEKSNASNQSGLVGARKEGTLGALLATQKATGKAFVVHKI
mmetsp:Transcript_12739/g.18140  ORF Transcript_12739/g.18140 Transcript_12739/m.18140 type:complete len:751 (+) Transcript_12739:39-2291(+)